jgi:Alw26I/Eco31I/Esp3I family type II restriction endonuclease
MSALKRGKGGQPEAESSSKYGGRGRPWHPEFIQYMEYIVAHPAYSGMPDPFYKPGRIQWEAPSNRKTGKFKDTHGKRLKWWALQAGKLGISTSSEKWISRVAKQIHPTKKKPCKICGRVLELRYVYPQARFLTKVKTLPFVKNSFPVDRLEPVGSLVKRLFAEYGDAALEAMPKLFMTQQVALPNPLPKNLSGWSKWVDEVFVPSEPRGILSPGAMSNPPDRFDGFHCDNLCCRGTADKGRHKKNLQTYGTDRRVFAYWTSGDWVAADRLMGQLRAGFPGEECRHGHPGPCTADHIGPISLGFTHRPRFQLLCGSCNSAKNNRMYRSDVELLKADEHAGEEVVSWHSAALWNACKGLVKSDEHARRLSKMMRDNRHSLMHALQAVADAGAYAFLASLLELERADHDVEFVKLRIEDHLTVFDNLTRTPRTTKYAAEQKARRCRIAFRELLIYFQKGNRNSFVVRDATSDKFLEEAIAVLKTDIAATAMLDKALSAAGKAADGTADVAFRELLPQIASVRPPSFNNAMGLLRQHMDRVGGLLTERWEDERYVRELEEAEEDLDEDNEE